MKAIKVTIEERGTNWVTCYGNEERHPVSMIELTRTQYYKMVGKTYPEYDITNPIMEVPEAGAKLVPDPDDLPIAKPIIKDDRFQPITDEERVAMQNKLHIPDEKFDALVIEPLEKLKVAMEVVDSDGVITDIGDEIDDIVESFQVEKQEPIHEAQIINNNNNNPLKQKTMETQKAKVEVEATVEAPSKVSKVSDFAKKQTHNAVTYGVTLPGHLVCKTIGDGFYALADGFANLELFSAKHLGQLPTELELIDGSKIPYTHHLGKLAVMQRSIYIQNVALVPIKYATNMFTKKPKDSEVVSQAKAI